MIKSRLFSSLSGAIILVSVFAGSVFAATSTAQAAAVPAFPQSQKALVTSLYRCALERQPDAAGLSYWSGRLQKGMSVQDLYSAFYTSDEFVNKNVTPNKFVDSMYHCMYFRNGDTGGRIFWNMQMTQNYATQDQIITAFFTSAEFTRVILPKLEKLPDDTKDVTVSTETTKTVRMIAPRRSYRLESNY